MRMYKTSSPIDDIDIKRVETLINWDLPDFMKSHYKKYNGGVPEKPYVNREGYLSIEIQSFIGIFHDINGRNIEQTYIFGTKQRNFLPKNTLPFAFDMGGNFFCIKASKDIIYLTLDSWQDNLSRDENLNRSTHIVSNSFESFLDGLVSEDDANM